MKTGVTPEINALCTLMLAVTLLVLYIYTMIKKHGKRRIKNEDEENSSRFNNNGLLAYLFLQDAEEKKQRSLYFLPGEKCLLRKF